MLSILAHQGPIERTANLVIVGAEVGAVVAALLVASIVRLPPVIATPTARGGVVAEGRAGRGGVVGLLVLALAILSGAVWDSLLAPTLIAVTWGLMLVVSVVASSAWRWTDPFLQAAQLVGRDRRPPAVVLDLGVLPAAVPAVVWTYYLYVQHDPFRPDVAATALLNYLLLISAGALLMGARFATGQLEVFGILFGWIGRIRSGGIGGWDPPRGAALVLGALAGGFLFGCVATSHFWVAGDDQSLVLWALAVVFGATVVTAAERWARSQGHPGNPSVAMVPVVAGLAFSLALADGALLRVVELLPARLLDPFAQGWDPLGIVSWIEGHLTRPPDMTGVQVGVVTVSGLAGIVVSRRRTGATRAPLPSLVSVATAVGVGVFLQAGT